MNFYLIQYYAFTAYTNSDGEAVRDYFIQEDLVHGEDELVEQASYVATIYDTLPVFFELTVN